MSEVYKAPERKPYDNGIDFVMHDYTMRLRDALTQIGAYDTANDSAHCIFAGPRLVEFVMYRGLRAVTYGEDRPNRDTLPNFKDVALKLLVQL